MENNPEEKYANIRQTIRSVILPLVQSIYDEDPADIISFCSGYFDGLLKAREINEKSTDDPNYKRTGEINQKTEEKEIVNEVLEVMKASNVQSSASEPLLTSDKHSEGLTLRETSSWDSASSSSHSVGSRVCLDCGVADAMSRIGDQAFPEKEENLESNAKAGDATVKQKEKEFENDSHVENKISCQATSPTRVNEALYAYAMPSAPPEENLDQSLKQVSKEKESENYTIREDLNYKKISQNLTIQETENDETIKSDVLNSSTTDQSSLSRVKGNVHNKLSPKQLSPNSSYGFIPHLSPYASEEEARKDDSKHNDDSSNKRKTDEEMGELTRKLSETLQSLAQEFSSAETNFNEKFQNAKEISDVLHGQREMKKHLKLTQDSDKDNGTTNGRSKANENSSFDAKDPNQSKDDKNNLVNSVNCPVFEPKLKQSSKDFVKKSRDLDIADSSKTVHLPREKSDVAHEIIRDYSHTGSSEAHDFMLRQMRGEQDDSTLSEDDRNDDSRYDGQEYRQTVDESWRRRWYEAHPRFDDMSDQHQRVPRFLRGYRAFNDNRYNESMHNIGEAGDVPPDRFYTAEEVVSESLGRSSLVVGESNSYGSFSADEIRRRGNSGRITRNFSDRDLTNTSATPIPSQNVPYSWRQMCRPQASSGSGDKFRQSSRKVAEEIPVPESNAKEDLSANNKAPHESENLSEVIIVKEVTKKSKTISSSESQNMSVVKKEKTEGEVKILEPEKNYIENISNKLPDNARLENSETKIKTFSSEVDEPVKSDNKNEHLNQQADCARSANRTSSESQHTDNDSCTDEEVVIMYVSSASGSQENESAEKEEPGLISAGGDFVLPIINGNNEQNFEPPSRVREENSANDEEQNQTPPGTVTVEYLQEIMARVTQQEEQDSFDCLNFCTYSGSDKSSDYSETDEFDSTV